MSSSSTGLPTPESSVSSAPNLPARFTDTFTGRYCEVRLHAVIGGEGPPLLLAHGWPQTWYAWRMLMSALARDFGVIAVDQLGIGLSDKPDDGYDTGTLAGDLVTLTTFMAPYRGGFGPVGGFEVKGNTVQDNTRSCRSQDFERNFSGIGIALLGARGMEVTGNHLSGNVPSGPTRISGGVVVSTDPYSSGSPKPMNNSVIGNHFGRNKPDIFWDGSGTGNVFRANYCNSSVPKRLCD
jgi:hypothetical protein